jgi:hypothetical protein
VCVCVQRAFDCDRSPIAHRRGVGGRCAGILAQPRLRAHGRRPRRRPQFCGWPVRACAVAQTGGYVIATRRGVRYAGSLALSLFEFTFTFPKFSAQRRGGAPTRRECLLRGSVPLKTSLAEGHECPFRLSCGLGVFGGAFVHRVYFAGVVYTRSLPSIHLKRFSLLFHLLLARRTSCGCARGRRRHESGGGDACESTVQQQLAPAVPLHLLPTRSASTTAAASRRRSRSRATEQKGRG